MRQDLTDTTFIIPLKLESPDRYTNFQILLQFLNDNFDTNIFIYEVGVKSSNEEGKHEEVPLIPELTKGMDHITHFFTSGFENEQPIPFHRTKYLNEMLSQVQTPITINHDADILMDPLNLTRACDEIRHGGFDLIYPFSIGNSQAEIKDKESLLSRVNTLGWSKDVLTSCAIKGWTPFMNPDEPSEPLFGPSTYGHSQVLLTQSYKDGGGENERFKGWAPEDKERYYRFRGLGYKTKHLHNALVFHLDHWRGPDSSTKQNTTYIEGWEEAFKVVNLAPEEFKTYAEGLKKYNGNN